MGQEGVTKSTTWPMWLLGFVVLTDQIDTSILRGVLSHLQEDFNLSDLQAGFLVSCFILVNGLVAIPAGYLADRLNRTKTVGTTMLAWSGVTAITAASQNYGHLVAVRSALGFGQAITEPANNSLIADFYRTDERGRAYSIRDVMGLVGLAIGLGLGGFVATQLSWRWAFLIVGSPSIFVAFLVFRLREPRRGESDRAHLGIAEDENAVDESRFADANLGMWAFVKETARGLVADLKTISQITTMRYALVGMTVLLFVITAIGVWLQFFYERQLGVSQGQGPAIVGALLVLGGVPGILLGGRFADRYVGKIKGGRLAVPAMCIAVGNTLFMISWYPTLTIGPVFLLHLFAIFAISSTLPALRAGLSDALPANLRGAGFGAFNLAAVVGGQAGAPLVIAGLNQVFDDNLRTSFFILCFPVFFGAFLLFRARNHLEEDTQKIFAAILRAMEEQKLREEELVQAADAAAKTEAAVTADGQGAEGDEVPGDATPDEPPA